MGGGLIKGTMASASPSVWEKAAPPALSLLLGNLFPPLMTVVPFELLPQCWSSEEVSVYVGPLRRTLRTPEAFSLTET